jgi:hypothetical protein
MFGCPFLKSFAASCRIVLEPSISEQKLCRFEQTPSKARFNLCRSGRCEGTCDLPNRRLFLRGEGAMHPQRLFAPLMAQSLHGCAISTGVLSSRLSSCQPLKTRSVE